MSSPVLSAEAQRAKAAVLGGLVADAASLGLHWVYDQDALLALVKGREGSPEFLEPQANKYYTHAPGTFSPYGSELFALLKAMAQDGAVDGPKLSQQLATAYTAEASNSRYLNHSSKTLVAGVSKGDSFPNSGDPADAQANAFVKAPAVVALYHGRPELASKLEEAVRVQQNNTPAVQAGVAGGLILEKVVQGHSIADALAWALKEGVITDSVKQSLQAMLVEQDRPMSVTAKKLGLSCGLPHSLQVAVLAGLKFQSSYEEGVRATIIAGGDNASRNCLVGALLAAQNGLESIPASWRAKTLGYAEAEAAVDVLLAANAKLSA
ncbi:MAG: hypothetical protein WDW38_004377 [Sanguina aurantia]